MAPAPGIDTTIYGSVATRAPGPPPAQVASADGRGLFMTTVAPAAPPRYVRAPVRQLAYAPAAPRGPYTLDSGDRLRVVVFGQDGLSNSYVVDASGHIDMPLIGPVSARGATPEELTGRIADRLRQGYIKEPHVAVEVEAYRPFFILGEVTQPGQYPYVADMTVETAVAIAGGFGPRAYRQTVTVTRVVNGAQIRMTVPPSYALRPGDTINVQERWF
jgi:polysaccharide biosynthesis/export protein